MRRLPVHLVVVIHVMPWEIEAYRTTMRTLEAGAALLKEEDSISLDVAFSTSGGVVDWKNSKMPRDELIEQFHAINEGIRWARGKRLVVDETGRTLGCTDHRRRQLRRAEPASTVVWLDPDIVFPPSAVPAMTECVRDVQDELYILTPQLPRMWDDTWDSLVHPEFSREETGFCHTFDTAGVYERAPLPSTRCPLRAIPEFKLAGGWLTAFSSGLLQLVGIPDSFKPYGEEDTYVMKVCTRMREAGWAVTQYVIEGLLVAPDFSVQENSTLSGRLSLIQDKLGNVVYNKSITDSEVLAAVHRIGNPRPAVQLQA